MQFLLIAYDAADSEAPNRRLAARPGHMALVKRNKTLGHARYGAAIVDEAKKMIGSMMVVEYPDRAALEAWLAEEPYVVGKVWDKITIHECRVAPMFV